MFVLLPPHGSYLIYLIIIGFFGLLIGSFLNVVIYRLPIMLQQEWEKDCNVYKHHKLINLFTPQSHCPICGIQISWWQNIPVISYILLGGKCKHCQNIIHWRYPAVETLSCITALIITIHFGINIQTFSLLILTWALIAAIFIDIEKLIIPDNITIPLIWLGLLLSTNHIFTTPENAIIGAISGYVAPWLIAYVFKLVRKIDGMGHGDFKLLAVFGAWLGWQILPVILFVASLLGSLVGLTLILSKKWSPTKPIPFGPYLACTGWLTFFWDKIF